jgi:hypothetical protein
LILTTDPIVIAQQMTLIDFSLYKKIEVTELLNQSWNKQKLKHRSPNVVSLIQRSTKVSMWIASLVLGSSNVNQRAKVIEKFIDVAQHLLAINNFNTFFGMVAGFSMSCIHRLKKTFKKVSSDRKKVFFFLFFFKKKCRNWKLL